MDSTQYPPGFLNQYIGYRLVAVAVTFIVLDIFFFSLRLYSRQRTEALMGMNDYLIYPSLFWCLAICVSCIAGVHYRNTGYHKAAAEQFHPAAIAIWLKFLIVVPVTHLFSVTFPKLAIIGIYLRIFTSRPYRIAVWAIFGFLIASALANVTVAIFECIPNGRCIDTTTFSKLTPLPSIATNIFLLILPLPMIWKLHISRNTKIGLVLTTFTGSIL